VELVVVVMELFQVQVQQHLNQVIQILVVVEGVKKMDLLVEVMVALVY
jgi:hypothetical protein